MFSFFCFYQVKVAPAPIVVTNSRPDNKYYKNTPVNCAQHRENVGFAACDPTLTQVDEVVIHNEDKQCQCKVPSSSNSGIRTRYSH